MENFEKYFSHEKKKSHLFCITLHQIGILKSLYREKKTFVIQKKDLSFLQHQI